MGRKVNPLPRHLGMGGAAWLPAGSWHAGGSAKGWDDSQQTSSP